MKINIKKLSFMLLFGVVFLFASIYRNMHRFNYRFGEATYRTAFFMLEDTVWSQGFSDEKFATLRMGMKKQVVSSILGEPLRKTCNNGKCEWVYSWQKTGNSSFDRREVIFNKEGHIQRIRHEFFID